MFLDRLNQRILITLTVSLLAHVLILSLFHLGRFSRPGKNSTLTDVEYVNMTDKPFGVRESRKPKPRPREVVDTAAKPAVETPAEPQPQEKEEEPEEAGDPNALPGDGGGDGKIFLPYYAVEQLPVFTNKIMPVYPEAARKLERASTVVLEAYVDVEGIVRKIRIVRSGGDLFDQAAIRALEVSKFFPARINGKPVPVKILVPYVFSLEK